MSDEVRQLKITPDTVEGFKLLQKLGQGATGTVFKAKRLSDGAAVAVKILFPALTRSPGFNERFLRLAQLGSRLDHPSVVRTLASGFSNGFHFVVMEFVEAKTLENVLLRGAMDESRALQIGLSIARALEHAQQAGVVHRDVKPANILLPRGGEAKLADLGLAVVSAQGAAAGGVTGTPHYLSPEAARGEAALDIKADLYSLGATLHHMLTGQTLFPGSDVARIIAAQLSERPKPPSKVNGTVSAQTSKLVERLTEKKPADRPTPAEAASAIESILRGEKPFETVSRRGHGARESAAAQTEIAEAPVLPPAREDETEVSERGRKNSPTAIVPPPVIPARQTSPREETVTGWPGAQQIPTQPVTPAAHHGPSPYPPVPPAGSPPGQRPQAYPTPYPPPPPVPAGGYPSPYPPSLPYPPPPPVPAGGYPSPHPPVPPYPPPQYPQGAPPQGQPPAPYLQGAPPVVQGHPPALYPPSYPWPPQGGQPAGQPPPPPVPPPAGSRPPASGKKPKRRVGRRWGDLI